MPFQTRCDPCRRARVKCDRHQPRCGRCTRSDLRCVWPTQTRFIDQNVMAAAQTHRARPGRVLDTTAVIPVTTDNFEDVTSPRIPWLNIATSRLAEPALYTPAERLALKYLSKWILFPCNHGVCPGYFQDLPQMYFACRQDHVLRLAVDSTILGYVSEHGSKKDIARRSQEVYGQALAKLAVLLVGDPVDDPTLAAVLLLDTYETVFLHSRGAHDQGLARIIQLRGPQQMFTEHAFHLWRIAHHRIQASRLLNLEGPMEESDRWLSMLDKTSIDMRVAEEGLKVISLNAKAKQVLDQATESDELIAQMTDLQATMERTMGSIDDDTEWLATTIEPTFEPAVAQSLPLTTSRKTLAIYHDLWAARTWNYHRVCLSMLLMMLVRLRESQGLQDERSISLIRELIEAILESVPMLLGIGVTTITTTGQLVKHGSDARDMGVVFLHLPMQAILGNSFSLARQREEARQVMRYMLANSFHANAGPVGAD